MGEAKDTGIVDASGNLRVPEGPVDLLSFDPGATPGFTGDKEAGQAALDALDQDIATLQEMLSADGYTGGHRSVLVVIQGMDTSGKGGVLKHVVGLLNPGGVRVKGFKAPTKEELAHDFLWRVERETPAAGQIGIFDRSHYEDVLVARVHRLAHEDEVERRYRAINDFERRLADQGTTMLKVMLHISPEEQRRRLEARLDDPTKLWKFKPEDIDEREHWENYQRAYELVLERCNTDYAPWHVIPADRKWYRTLAIATVLRDALAAMDLDWPSPDFDVDEQRRRLSG